MKVTAKQIALKAKSFYTLWDKEVYVTVTQDCGAHGFYSAAIVVQFMDGPLKAMAYSGYNVRDAQLRKEAMLAWIAAQLTKLSKGTHFNKGNECLVEGLKIAK